MDGKVGESGIKPKSLTYFLLASLFTLTSYLSFVFVRGHFGGGDVFSSLGFLSAKAVAGLCVLLSVYFLFDTLRFFYVLKALKIDIGIGYMLKLTFINIFISNITPFATGGGFVQIYFLTKKNVPLGKAVAASTIRTLLATILLFAAAPAASAANLKLYEQLNLSSSYVFWAVLIVFYGSIGLFVFLMFKNVRLVKYGFYRLLKFFERRKVISRTRTIKTYRSFASELGGFKSSIRLFLKGDKLCIFLAAAYTVMFLLSLFMFPALLTGAMGYQIPLTNIIKTQTIVTFLTYFAPTPGASGVAEVGFALLFSDMVTAGDVAALTLSWRFFTIYIGVFLGFLVFYSSAFMPGRRTPKKER